MSPMLAMLAMIAILAGLAVGSPLATHHRHRRSLLQQPSIVDIASSDPRFTTLVAAVQAAGLVDTLSGGEWTVFAPTNDAFASLLAALGVSAEDLLSNTDLLSTVLKYHVVQGKVLSTQLQNGPVPTVLGPTVAISGMPSGPVLVNDATVILADVEASNGVIHVIDKVLTPPAEFNPDTVDDTPAEASSSIVDIASSDPRFTTLVAAVQAAGLVDTLSGGEWTVFAPTNDAFASLLAALGVSAEDLLSNTDLLSTVLKYHVVQGKVLSTQLQNGPVPTALGPTVAISGMPSGPVMVNDAMVILADVEASNGVIHVIDKVLTPPESSPPDAPAPETTADTPSASDLWSAWRDIAGGFLSRAGSRADRFNTNVRDAVRNFRPVTVGRP